MFEFHRFICAALCALACASIHVPSSHGSEPDLSRISSGTNLNATLLDARASNSHRYTTQTRDDLNDRVSAVLGQGMQRLRNEADDGHKANQLEHGLNRRAEEKQYDGDATAWTPGWNSKTAHLVDRAVQKVQQNLQMERLMLSHRKQVQDSELAWQEDLAQQDIAVQESKLGAMVELVRQENERLDEETNQLIRRLETPRSDLAANFRKRSSPLTK
eukprot:TRINITY_DN58156_c0_g1_i1.p1 TRINITY_DN58156_c0_g1~~TRINITY_DN58156_c0_g1_i1.p1  ORF type:complete len:217 (+),score=25.64 TRINITY_DN58156_c0_g1_i1:79-729(+)